MKKQVGRAPDMTLPHILSSPDALTQLLALLGRVTKAVAFLRTNTSLQWITKRKIKLKIGWHRGLRLWRRARILHSARRIHHTSDKGLGYDLVMV